MKMFKKVLIMKKSIITLALIAASGSVFAKGMPGIAASEGVEVRSVQTIEQICAVTAVNTDGNGFSFKDVGFSGVPASISVYSNVMGVTGLNVSFSDTSLYTQGAGASNLPAGTMGDGYGWVVKSDTVNQAVNFEGEHTPAGEIIGMGDKVIELFPYVNYNITDMPAGDLVAEATVTVYCNAK